MYVPVNSIYTSGMAGCVFFSSFFSILCFLPFVLLFFSYFGLSPVIRRGGIRRSTPLVSTATAGQSLPQNALRKSGDGGNIVSCLSINTPGMAGVVQAVLCLRRICFHLSPAFVSVFLAGVFVGVVYCRVRQPTRSWYRWRCARVLVLHYVSLVFFFRVCFFFLPTYLGFASGTGGRLGTYVD